ncbi:LysR substrate-binding domain-containing protein [Paraburkholderia lycopersici]|uniref:DNA-binding transcriptional regulator, LysR family n=1 Tax=Paraburkholderia lycopersici TaxID=416944 RepID=A0A1G7A0A2_9BURK|nr:LysR substrate-binding domain-containing protein [Paraburkholderia lycopersici]SDE08239.1 DNA-binding transcriptional regulator, LysR family [Paraburkholderia lycopersici]
MNLHRLDFTSLLLFTLIVRSGSISSGAKQAHISLASASKRMSVLEAAIGTETFERHSRGIKLTPAGQALYRHAQRILGDVDLLLADLSDYVEGVMGVVRLWANTSAITQFLPGDIASFIAAHPTIRIELEEQNSGEVVRAVLDGEADFGILADRIPTYGLETLPYRQDKLVLVVPAGHPLGRKRAVSFDQAADYEFVSLPRATSLAQRLDLATSAAGKRLKLRIQVRSFDAMCQMVAAGLGVAVLPDAAVSPHLRSMGLRKLELNEEWATRELLFCARDFRALPKPARLLIQFLQTASSNSYRN